VREEQRDIPIGLPKDLPPCQKAVKGLKRGTEENERRGERRRGVGAKRATE